MPNTLGLMLWIIGILSIIISIYILNLVTIKYLKKYQFKNHFYLILILLIILIIFRIASFFYIDYMSKLDLPYEILSEKLLFVRMFSHIPLAIAVSILLFVCYGCLTELKYKLIKSS